MATQKDPLNNHVNMGMGVTGSVGLACELAVVDSTSSASEVGGAEWDALLPNHKSTGAETENLPIDSRVPGQAKSDGSHTLSWKEVTPGPRTTESPHSSLDEEASCRICQDGELYEKLVSPCLCSGTVGFVHVSCLNTWLQITSRTSCELCGFPFPVMRRKAPISEYLKHPRANMDLPNLVCDLACLVILTPLLFTSVYLSSTGTLRYESLGHAGSLCAVVTLLVALVLVYISWAALAVVYHVRVWKAWRDRHSTVTMIRESQILNRQPPAKRARAREAKGFTHSDNGASAKSFVQQQMGDQANHSIGLDTAIILAPINRLSGWIRVNNRVAVRSLPHV
ncbi:hypothetical protein EGW08_018699 [Elysia chlorotica]|uniref:RING-CH-type domain-containing protein n=1 Tax=Elysia chlorotica TaxID=188477 RepID=A0A3S1BS05_ELYCH|nr:hypothetical protein EGW08_018699 [Elysia chlorotica]